MQLKEAYRTDSIFERLLPLLQINKPRQERRKRRRQFRSSPASRQPNQQLHLRSQQGIHEQLSKHPIDSRTSATRQRKRNPLRLPTQIRYSHLLLLLLLYLHPRRRRRAVLGTGGRREREFRERREVAGAKGLSWVRGCGGGGAGCAGGRCGGHGDGGGRDLGGGSRVVLTYALYTVLACGGRLAALARGPRNLAVMVYVGRSREGAGVGGSAT